MAGNCDEFVKSNSSSKPYSAFYYTMSDITNHIRERFPDQSDAIAILMAKDPEFHSICEDYGECIKAYSYWIRSKEPEAATRVNEYRNLIQALEAEVEEALLGPQPQRPD